MTIPFWCLLVAALIPYILAGVGAAQKARQFDSLDIHHPRDQDAKLTGMGARAVAAQKNAWEAFAVFSAAVLVAHAAGAAPGTSATAAVAFIAFRALHAIAYLRDVATLRSVAFGGGFACCIWLFVLAANA
jgi:uncharacterized MAPEG superfamily protein